MAQVTTKISALTKFNQLATVTRERNKLSRGFTLIEIMIVMAIVAAVITLGISQINKSGNDTKEALRKISTLTKQLHSMAKLNTATYRLVFDLGSGRDDAEQSYWVEKAVGTIVRTEEDLSKQFEEKLNTNESDEPAAPQTGGFSKDEKILKGIKTLPGAVRFVHVESPSSKDPVTSGNAYIYFFPQGLADEALVQIKGKGAAEKMEYTLAVRPLNGRMDIISGLKLLKDFQE